MREDCPHLRIEDKERAVAFNLRAFAVAHSFATILCVSTFDPKFINFKKPRREGQLITVGRVEDVPSGRGATIEVQKRIELSLYNGGGEFYANENLWPHKGAPLGGGHLS